MASLASNIAGVAFAVAFIAANAAAQSSADSIGQSGGGPTRAWLSLGLGGGSSPRGGVAGRAAASIAANRILTFTLEAAGVGDIDGDIGAVALMAGVQTPRPDAFLYLSAGPANVSCGPGCGNQTGITVDGGYHIGAAHAGVSVAAFVVRAPHGSNSSGMVAALDLGWFDRRAARNAK